ncbi:hypothetical protein BC827DRAFT_1238484 [Russula dissimulans]|nr:hypothetical protein BC827DRAFT_1238484 [Russula dissimulans]
MIVEVAVCETFEVFVILNSGMNRARVVSRALRHFPEYERREVREGHAKEPWEHNARAEDDLKQ